MNAMWGIGNRRVLWQNSESKGVLGAEVSAESYPFSSYLCVHQQQNRGTFGFFI